MMDDDSNTIECARCGATFYYELTRCPNCGVNVYLPEEDDADWTDSLRQNESFNKASKVLSYLLALLAGWFVTAFIGLMLFLPIRFTLIVEPSTTELFIFLTFTLALGTFAGGFIAMRIANHNTTLTGLLGGAGGLLILLIGSSNESGTIFPLSIWTLLGWGLVLTSAYAGAVIAERMLSRIMADSLFAGVKNQQELYDELLSKVGYDRQRVERLIDYERQQTAQATRTQLLRNAIEHWNRDNRIGRFYD